MLGCHVDAVSIGDAVADACHSYSVCLRRRMVLEPGAEVEQQLVVVFEPRTKTESVIASRINVHGAFVACVAHSCVVCQSVGDERNEAVIAGGYDDGRRCQMAFNGILCGELTYQFWILLSFFAEEVFTRILVRNSFVHRDNRVEQDREVGTYFIFRVSRND